MARGEEHPSSPPPPPPPTMTDIPPTSEETIDVASPAPSLEMANEGGDAGEGEGDPPAAATTVRDPTYSTSEVDDGSLMQFYESRLKRLRDYETRVLSRYKTGNNSNGQTAAAAAVASLRATQEVSTKSNEGDRLDGPGLPPSAGGNGFSLPAPDHVQYTEKRSASEKPEEYFDEANMYEPDARSSEPPKVIEVSDSHVPESLDDITLSTGMSSTPLDESSRRKLSSLDASEVPVDERNGIGSNVETCVDIESPVLSRRDRDNVSTDYSTESSETYVQNAGKMSTNSKPDHDDNNNEPYSYIAADDSKFETYSLLVDLDQEDRSVEIALYSAARPHMRGFHLAWASFFVAFFTWFAMTPLLKDIQKTLDLDRKEIWNSSVLAVAGSAVTRILIGPINDIYGARWSMAGTLILSAIPTAIAGLVIHNALGLYLIRLLIGVAGSAFVTCQFWTSSMFTMEVAGTANSLAAGWGNLGGGVAQVVMGSLLFPLFKVVYGGHFGGSAEEEDINDGPNGPTDLAWRTVMVAPAIMSLVMAYHCIRHGDDCPKGNFRKRQKQGLMPTESATDAIRRAAFNKNTWLLFIQYGCCFGVEITMTNAAALYFQDEFGQNTESAAAIASVFGWMNLFARGIGGFLSDMANANYGMRGRLFVQVFTLLGEGALVCAFSTTQTLAKAIVVMVIFSIFVQAAEGSTFGFVSYVDYSVTGSVAGIIGAGGNVGGVVFSLFFRQFPNREAFRWMGYLVLASASLSTLLAIPGHRSLFFGEDAAEVLSRRDTRAEQLGSLPNLDLHTHSADSHRNRLSTRR